MSMSNREEIERSLQRGAEILAERPELKGMALEDILNDFANCNNKLDTPW